MTYTMNDALKDTIDTIKTYCELTQSDDFGLIAMQNSDITSFNDDQVALFNAMCDANVDENNTFNIDDEMHHILSDMCEWRFEFILRDAHDAELTRLGFDDVAQNYGWSETDSGIMTKIYGKGYLDSEIDDNNIVTHEFT